MAIPESQLDVWAKQGAVVGSRDTYGAIRSTLTESGSPYSSREFSVFLQGSYGNDTNIYAESDVDIVIQLKSQFYQDIAALSESQKVLYNRLFSPGNYGYSEFKADVLSHLTSKYGQGVQAGSKAIAIPAYGNRRKADVIVSLEYRKYTSFYNTYTQSYVEGIKFYTSSWSEVINYPKQHSANLTRKHQDTGQWFKPVARIFKNLRSRLQDKGKLSPGDAPSYYIEGLLYNVPSELFRTNYATCVSNALNWLHGANKSALLCANEQYPLLWWNSNTSWEHAKCDKFLTSAIDAWNSW